MGLLPYSCCMYSAEGCQSLTAPLGQAVVHVRCRKPLYTQLLHLHPFLWWHPIVIIAEEGMAWGSCELAGRPA